MDERQPSKRRRPADRGGDEWRLDPSDVRRHQRLQSRSRDAGWLGKALKYSFAALLLVGAGALWLNRESLRGITIDTSAFDRLFGGGELADGSGRRPLFGGAPETVAVEAGGVAGTAAPTSLDGSAPPPPEATVPGSADSSSAASAIVAPAEPIAGAVPPPVVAAPAPAPRAEPDPGPEIFGFAATGFDADAVITVVEADPNAAIIVGRSGGRRGPTAITWWTTDGTASARSDYADRGVLVEKFGQGEQNRTLRVPIVGGGAKEADETFYVHFALNDADGRPIKSEEQKIAVVIKDDD